MADCIILNRDVSQTTELQTETLVDTLTELHKELKLMNLRVEEAFDTKTTKEDIEDE